MQYCQLFKKNNVDPATTLLLSDEINVLKHKHITIDAQYQQTYSVTIEVGRDMNSIIRNRLGFMQDGAPPHIVT